MNTIKPSIATPWYKRTITIQGKVQTRPGQIICSDKTLERGRDHVHGRTHCIYSIDLCVKPRVCIVTTEPMKNRNIAVYCEAMCGCLFVPRVTWDSVNTSAVTHSEATLLCVSVCNEYFFQN